MGDEHKHRMLYAEELVREFLLFRGFTPSLRSFESDLSSDLGHGFQVNRIIELFFVIYIPRFEADKVHALLAFLSRCFFTTQDAVRAQVARKFETALKRYYIVHALQKGRVDRVLEFFQCYGASLLQSGEDWHAWFALPYIKSPQSDPRFQVYFSRDWLDTLVVSFGNFLNEVFNGIRFPALLKVSSEIMSARTLKHEVEKLCAECDNLRGLLAKKEDELAELKRRVSSGSIDSNQQSESSSSSLINLSIKALAPDENCGELQSNSRFVNAPTSAQTAAEHFMQEQRDQSAQAQGENGQSATSAVHSNIAADGAEWLEDEFPEVSYDSQECFSGHTSPISRCRFSASGANIASASIDGTVRIWNSDSTSSTSRNATIYCAAEVTSLEWDFKTDRLLLIGTAERGIKAWNVDAKRVVCDLATDTAYPRILDLKCSPVESIFASAASSSGFGRQGTEAMGFASLTLWNMKSWKPLTSLPLGEDPPAITSVCFNHNGKILAAGATDGMIHLFDTYARLPITGWPAHYSSVSCVKFGPDQASIFSLGADGKVYEWSLHNQGQVLQEQDASRFFQVRDFEVPRHEMALDAQGKMLLLTSNSSTSPLYHMHQRKTQRTLQHNAGVTSVDWHPMQSRYLTGSADHSVRVTLLLPS